MLLAVPEAELFFVPFVTSATTKPYIVWRLFQRLD
jgi:hypothetical protein